MNWLFLSLQCRWIQDRVKSCSWLCTSLQMKLNLTLSLNTQWWSGGSSHYPVHHYASWGAIIITSQEFTGFWDKLIVIIARYKYLFHTRLSHFYHFSQESIFYLKTDQSQPFFHKRRKSFTERQLQNNILSVTCSTLNPTS